MKGLDFRRNHPDGVLFIKNCYIPEEPIDSHPIPSLSTDHDLLGYPPDHRRYLRLDPIKLLPVLGPHVCLPLERLGQLDALDDAPRVLVLAAEDTHEHAGQRVQVRVREAVLRAVAEGFRHYLFN